MNGKNKKPKRKQTFVKDELINLMSGLGVLGKDKGPAATYVKPQRDFNVFSEMYAGTRIARKLVEIVPGDMTREWRNFDDSGLKEDQITDFERFERRLKVKSKVREALVLARIYGGSLLIPVLANGDTDLSEPLDMDSIGEGDLKGFTVVGARYASAAGMIDQDPTSETYLKPTHYSLTGAQKSTVHASRVIRFEGLYLPREEFQKNRWWSQSVMDAAWKEITNATTVSDSLAALMHELNLDIINIKGLSNALSAGQEDKIKNRFETYAFAKSLFNMAILDEEETFSNRVMPASGISDLIDKFYGLLAAVEDIPATRFLGSSPGGLNATGESDLTNYYDMVSDKQECDLDPRMWKIDTLLSKSLWGDVPEEIHDYTWNSLWQETEKETADRELVDAQRDQIYLQNSVVTEAQVASQLKTEGVYTTIEDSHIKDLEDFASQGEEDIEGIFNATNQPPASEGTNQDQQESSE